MHSYGLIRKLFFPQIFLLIIILTQPSIKVYGQISNNQDSIVLMADDLEEVVLTSERTVSPTPLSITRLTISEQNFSAVERVDQFLNFVPGVEMQSGALNTNRIHIRGIGSRSPFATSKIRAYINDIPLTDGIGETSIEDLNLGFLDRVELWKGPFSSAYGAPLGGIIRFNTPPLSDVSKVHTEVTVGDFGFYRMENSAIFKTGQHSQLMLIDEMFKSDGYRANNELSKHNFNALWNQTGDHSTISLLFSYIDLEAQIPSSLNLNDFNDRPAIAAPNWQSVDGYEDNQKIRLGINYKHTFENQSFMSSTLYGYLYDAYELRPFNVLDDESRAISLRTRYYMPFGKFNIEVGQETFLEKYEYNIYETLAGGQGSLENRVKNDRRLINIYSEYYYNLTNKIRLGGGLNLNFTSFKINELLTGVSTSSEYDPVLSPRFYLSYNATSDLRLRVDAAHGFANPSIDESTGLDGLFNNDIKQEEGWSYELSSSYVPSSRFKILATFFYMNVKDIIVNRQNVDGQTFGINGGSTHHRGLELSPDFQLVKDPRFEWHIKGNITLGSFRFRNFVDGMNDYSGNQLTGVAPVKWSMQSLFQWGKTTFSFIHRYVDAIPVNDANSVSSEPFHISNLLFQQTIKAGPVEVRLTAEIENLFNNAYASMVAVNASSFGGNAPRYYYPGLPVNGKMTLNIAYKW